MFLMKYSARFILLFLHMILLSATMVLDKSYAAEPTVLPSPVIGANKFDLFTQYSGTANGGDGSASYLRVTRALAKKALDDAKDAGISFMRVSMSGRTSKHQGDKSDSLYLWQTNPEAFWRQVDEMMDDLDARGIQIVPVLMWATGKFPMMTGEPLGELLTNPKSKSWGLLTNFVTDFVTRYRKRHTILFYELTNELNNYADLDILRRCHKAEEECKKGDRFTSADMVAYTKRFADLVRSLDNTRQISSGFSIPRRSADHLRLHPEWTTQKTDWREDSLSQFAENLKSIHSAVDIISIHLYGGKQNSRFGSNNAVDLLVEAKHIADSVGKPLFVGEFGDSNPEEADTSSHVVQMINKIIELRIPYSAVWVWELNQPTTYRTYENPAAKFSLEPGYTDFLINKIQQANTGAKISDDKVKRQDTTAPRVVLTWPLECAALRKSVDLHAIANDDSGAIEKVEFLVDEKTIMIDKQIPYQTTFSPSETKPGKHRLTVRAYDLAGNVAEFSSDVITGNHVINMANCLANMR